MRYTRRRKSSYFMLSVMVLYVLLHGMSYGGAVNLSKFNRHRCRIHSFSIKDNPYKYGKYYFDSESGMYYCQARYYSPDLMRFINRDTYDLSNRYAYCEGNPINKVDPSGHMSMSMLGKGMGMAAGILLSFMPGPLGIILPILGQEIITRSTDKATGTQIGSDQSCEMYTLMVLGISTFFLGVCAMIGEFVRAGTKIIGGIKMSQKGIVAKLAAETGTGRVGARLPSELGNVLERTASSNALEKSLSTRPGTPPTADSPPSPPPTPPRTPPNHPPRVPSPPKPPPDSPPLIGPLRGLRGGQGPRPLPDGGGVPTAYSAYYGDTTSWRLHF